jgi:membrane associated rhomboid family serine protease
MVGASGAIYGVFAALTILEPDIRVYVYFVPMKLKHALVLFAIFDFLMINSSDMIAHTAHLSGLFVGLYMGFRIKKIQESAQRSRYIGRW